MDEYFVDNRLRSEVIVTLRNILGEFSSLVGLGFVPSISNPHVSPYIHSIPILMNTDWVDMSAYEASDPEVSSLMQLVGEMNGLDLLPQFYLDIQVCSAVISVNSENE